MEDPCIALQLESVDDRTKKPIYDKIKFYRDFDFRKSMVYNIELEFHDEKINLIQFVKFLLLLHIEIIQRFKI